MEWDGAKKDKWQLLHPTFLHSPVFPLSISLCFSSYIFHFVCLFLRPSPTLISCGNRANPFPYSLFPDFFFRHGLRILSQNLGGRRRNLLRVSCEVKTIRPTRFAILFLFLLFCQGSSMCLVCVEIGIICQASRLNYVLSCLAQSNRPIIGGGL